MATNVNGQATEVTKAGRDSKKFTRFPRTPIESVLEFPKKIIAEGYDLKKDRLCGLLNKAVAGGTTDKLIAAARAYGLIEDNAEGYISATDLGRRACSDAPELRSGAFAEAVSHVDPFRTFLSRYGSSKVPSEGVAEDYLSQNLGLTRQEAKKFYSVVMDNARAAGLTENLPGGEFFRDSPVAPAPPAEDTGNQGIDPVPAQPTVNQELKPSDPKKDRSVHKEVEMHFNIQVHLPESPNPEVYDAIFKSIRDNLIGE